MTTPERHDVISAQLGEYALGSLSPEEQRAVEHHVRECAACAAELNELRLVMEGLARAPEPVAPPAALKQRVLARLAHEPQEHLTSGVQMHSERRRRCRWTGQDGAAVGWRPRPRSC